MKNWQIDLDLKQEFLNIEEVVLIFYKGQNEDGL